MAEQQGNFGRTSLNGSINASQTSVTVLAGSVLPSSGDFRLRCESELMLCTARATNVLTVTRGIEGTSGVAHDDGRGVLHVLTAAGFAAEIDERIATHAGLADPHVGYRLESANHSHASSGLQGGTIAHSATTGQGVNDHHNEAHTVPSHTGTPGGELGGTWTTPTVDATHSGSAHHAQSHDGNTHTGVPGGELGGTWATPTVDATHSGSAHHADVHTMASTGPHAQSGLTAGHFMRASAAAAFDFAAILDADIPSSIARDSEVTADIATHAGLADPHTGYLRETVVSAVATPAVVLGTAAAAGTGTSVIRHNSTIVAFDITAPDAITFGQAAAVGVAPVAARRDHAHAMVADPVTAHAAAGDPHTGYRLESADHTHATTGLQGGTIAHSATTGKTANDHHAESHTVPSHTGTPGGELGGTWTSPTVDATHSGSAHTNIPAQTAALNMGGFAVTGIDYLWATAATDFEMGIGSTHYATLSTVAHRPYSNGLITSGQSGFGWGALYAAEVAAPATPAAGSGVIYEKTDNLLYFKNDLGTEYLSSLPTAPGGELGGTWAAPTVDATHSGSAHHTKYTNAEAITAVEGEATLVLGGVVSMGAGGAPNIKTVGGTGAGLWFDGNVTAQRLFLGMNSASDSVFRFYSVALAANVALIDLSTGNWDFNAHDLTDVGAISLGVGSGVGAEDGIAWDSDTGFYSTGDGNITVEANNVMVATFDGATGLWMKMPIRMDDQPIYNASYLQARQYLHVSPTADGTAGVLYLDRRDATDTDAWAMFGQINFRDNAAKVHASIEGARWSTDTDQGYLRFATTDSTGTLAERIHLQADTSTSGRLSPSTDGQLDLGVSTTRWTRGFLTALDINAEPEEHGTWPATGDATAQPTVLVTKDSPDWAVPISGIWGAGSANQEAYYGVYVSRGTHAAPTAALDSDEGGTVVYFHDGTDWALGGAFYIDLDAAGGGGTAARITANDNTSPTPVNRTVYWEPYAGTGTLPNMAWEPGSMKADLGAPAAPWRNVYLSAAFISSGTGTPESAVTAPIGSLFMRTDGGAGTSFYVKESGTGNTGWVAK